MTLRRSSIVPRDGETKWVRFWHKYQTEADEYDREFLERYKEDMSTTMIFVSPPNNVDPALFLSHNIVRSFHRRDCYRRKYDDLKSQPGPQPVHTSSAPQHLRFTKPHWRIHTHGNAITGMEGAKQIGHLVPDFPLFQPRLQPSCGIRRCPRHPMAEPLQRRR